MNGASGGSEVSGAASTTCSGISVPHVDLGVRGVRGAHAHRTRVTVRGTRVPFTLFSHLMGYLIFVCWIINHHILQL